ncbi:hypothetical protein MIR68_009528 [Amoeboaphelidium protococcarum]|nr:hypothetical protein MIR68_009528 [Amoeboaphelidium protococcarum]
MGRKKLKISPIENDRARQMTFNKRKNGLIKKAHELAVLCGIELALIVITPQNKLIQYSSGEMDHALLRYTDSGEPVESRDNQDFAQMKIDVDSDGEEYGADESSPVRISVDRAEFQQPAGGAVRSPMAVSGGPRSARSFGRGNNGTLRIDTSQRTSPQSSQFNSPFGGAGAVNAVGNQSMLPSPNALFQDYNAFHATNTTAPASYQMQPYPLQMGRPQQYPFQQQQQQQQWNQFMYVQPQMVAPYSPFSPSAAGALAQQQQNYTTFQQRQQTADVAAAQPHQKGLHKRHNSTSVESLVELTTASMNEQLTQSPQSTTGARIVKKSTTAAM